jgi:hypothetical protein
MINLNRVGEQLSFLCDEAPPVVYLETPYEQQAALVCICSSGSHGRVLYKTTIGDAQKICSLPETQGCGRGGAWLLAWTSEENFAANGGTLEVNRDFERKTADDGRFSALFDAHGIVAIPFRT